MRGEEEGEAGDQAYQAEQGDAPDCAYCTVGGVMHAYLARDLSSAGSYTII
eukprot:COSAG01_NODE_1879_length_8994_cov_5.920292_7_plen_51_part_00